MIIRQVLYSRFLINIIPSVYKNRQENRYKDRKIDRNLTYASLKKFS